VSDLRRRLLAMIDADRDALVDLLSRLVRARSPNPPGDTRAAAAVLAGWLEVRGVPYRVVACNPTMPNLIGSIEGARAGPHLVLNGHIDTFPPVAAERWTDDPFSGRILDDKVWGTGSSDMKQGTASLVAVYGWLHALKAEIGGRLTLTAVSDEETFGPNGARYLLEHHSSEVLGDCLLNAEPGAPTTVRFAEKAPLWIGIDIETVGAHGAYPHKSPSATRIAAALIEDLAAIEETDVELPPALARAIANGAPEIDRIHLAGAAANMGRVTLNIGTWNGGMLVNMLPGHSRIEADIRLPWGVSPTAMVAKVGKIVARYSHASMRVISSQAPEWSDPDHIMVDLIRRNAREIAGLNVRPIPSLAGTDARLWRQRGVPAFTYGTTATNVAMPDEHTDINEWLGVVKTHALSALDYLSRGATK
jgi:succinyl-diaminopimelate desuccinylase